MQNPERVLMGDLELFVHWQQAEEALKSFTIYPNEQFSTWSLTALTGAASLFLCIVERVYVLYFIYLAFAALALWISANL